jgi:hypothetical protein
MAYNSTMLNQDTSPWTGVKRKPLDGKRQTINRHVRDEEQAIRLSHVIGKPVVESNYTKHIRACHASVKGNSRTHKPEKFTDPVDLASHLKGDICECECILPNLDSACHRRTFSTRARGISCGGCCKLFPSLVQLAMHIEAGFCPGGSNRHTLKREVLAIDKHHFITEPGAEKKKGRRYYATKEDAWNGYAFECRLCTNEYRTLGSLNRHLGSATHDEKIYVCPEWTCRNSFSALGALLQHFENGSCGAIEIAGVQGVLNAVLGKAVSPNPQRIRENVACGGCSRSFKSGCDLAIHSESGFCSSRRDHNSMNHLSLLMDKEGLITEPVFVGGERPRGLIYGDVFMCSSCRKKFRTKLSLKQHLESRVHEHELYICAASCRRRFSTLSALWRHVERGGCGVKDVKGVRVLLDDILGRMVEAAMW